MLRLYGDRRHGDAAGSGDITLGDYIQTWLELRRASAEVTTIDTYTAALENHVPDRMKRFRLQDVQNVHLRDLALDRIRTGLSGRTVGWLLGILGAVFASAVTERLIEYNPAIGLRRALRLGAKDRKPEIKAMTSAQLNAFLSTAARTLRDHTVHAAIVTLAWTGLRLGELHGLRETDLDFDEHVIRVLRQVRQRGDEARLKTESSRRNVDMAPDLETVLRGLLARRSAAKLAAQPVSEHLFIRPGRTPVAERLSIRRSIRAVCREANIPDHFGPHSFRHTFATLLLSAGHDPRYVQHQEGHATLAMTVDTYGRWERSSNRAAVDDLAKKSGGAPDLERTGDVLSFKGKADSRG